MRLLRMAEHTRIARMFAPLCAPEAGAFLLQNDAALLTPPKGKKLVVTTDSVIEGVHVPVGTSPTHIAQKLLRRNLSDLAAMGAQPWRYSLNLHTPRGTAETWFSAFARSLSREQKNFAMVLIGGDTTSAAESMVHVSATLLGLAHRAHPRSRARAGDGLYVSGTIGDAAAYFWQRMHSKPITPALAARFYVPSPRLALGQALQGIASSVIDISDGLVADTAQLCRASNVGAQIDFTTIPRSHAYIASRCPALETTNFGDDYELLFTVPKAKQARLAALSKRLGLRLTRIGEMTATMRVEIMDAQGKSLTLPQGFSHD
jgi:thiamine-monophosphate kinase